MACVLADHLLRHRGQVGKIQGPEYLTGLVDTTSQIFNPVSQASRQRRVTARPQFLKCRASRFSSVIWIKDIAPDDFKVELQTIGNIDGCSPVGHFLLR